MYCFAPMGLSSWLKKNQKCLRKISCRSMASDVSHHLQSRHLLAFHLARLIAKYQYLDKGVRKESWIFAKDLLTVSFTIHRLVPVSL